MEVFWMTQVLLPKVLEWYSGAVGITSSTSLLEWVCQNVCGKLEAQIQQFLKLNRHKSPAHCLRWLPYRFRFRYILVDDLAHHNHHSNQWLCVGDGVSLGIKMHKSWGLIAWTEVKDYKVLETFVKNEKNSPVFSLFTALCKNITKRWP